MSVWVVRFLLPLPPHHLHYGAHVLLSPQRPCTKKPVCTKKRSSAPKRVSVDSCEKEFCTKNRKPKGGGGKVGFVGRNAPPPYGRWEGQSTYSWKGVNKPPNRPKPVVRNHILPQESDMRCKICAKRGGAFYGPLRDCAVVVGGLLPSCPVGHALGVYAPT